MRDLVESVIDGILQQEKMQQQAQRQQKHRAAMPLRPARTKPIDQTRLHATGPQIPAPNTARDPALWKVSVQFEAIFVQQMMSEMRQTVHKSDFMPSGFAEDIHGSMMDEAIAQASVRHHSFGIADNIYRQLEASQSRSRPSSLQQFDLKQAGSKQPESIQEISASADKLKLNNSVTLEVSRHAN